MNAVLPSRPIEYRASSYVFCSVERRRTVQPLRVKTPQRTATASPHTTSARDKKYTNQQAVMERVCDEKSGERRGDQLQITTPPVACFRKIFAAQIPPSPQRDQAGIVLLKPRRKDTKRDQQSPVSQATSRTPNPTEPISLLHAKDRRGIFSPI